MSSSGRGSGSTGLQLHPPVLAPADRVSFEIDAADARAPFRLRSLVICSCLFPLPEPPKKEPASRTSPLRPLVGHTPPPSSRSWQVPETPACSIPMRPQVVRGRAKASL
jgi:hypothetical protein